MRELLPSLAAYVRLQQLITIVYHGPVDLSVLGSDQPWRAQRPLEALYHASRDATRSLQCRIQQVNEYLEKGTFSGWQQVPGPATLYPLSE